MTILPKKKQNKDKNDAENSDHPIAHSHHGHHHPPAQETRLEKVGRGRSSPTRWLPTGSRDEMLAHHDPGGAFECHDTSAAHNKRRHRSSPHRNVRKHRGGHSGSAVATHGTTGASTEYEDTGNNSGDEYVPPPHPENIEELERWFEETLKEKKGFIIKRMGEDGACLFRAVADQVYGDQEMHSLARKHCIDYMAKNSDFYQHYVTEDFTTYLNRKRLDSCHGNHLEMQAICEIFNRPIEVYQYSLEPINTFHGAYKTDNEPIRISYHRNIHYNSVVDPYKATIGVGLGLPSFQPGLAEKNLMRDAKRISEDVHLEKAMLEDKLRETDWEVTQETIEEQVARESYLQWLRDNEKRAVRQGSPRTASATCSSSSEYPPLENLGSPESRLGRSPRSKCGTSNSGQNSPQRPDDQGSPKAAMDQLSLASGSPKPMQTTSETTSPLDDTLQGAVGGFDETHSLMNDFPASMYGLSDWDEDEILAQVIAQSQQEYLDSLKKNAASTPSLFSSSSSSSSPSSSSLLPSTSTPSPTDASCSTCSNVQNKGKS